MSKTFFRLRGAVALGMVVLIYFMIVTGTTLWIAQQGGVLPQALWSFASRFHPIGGFTMFILGIVHVTLNKKLFRSDLEALFRKERR
ncbi:MAG: hypothetical protein ABDK87_08865 [Atribacterota bacterium]